MQLQQGLTCNHPAKEMPCMIQRHAHAFVHGIQMPRIFPPRRARVISQVHQRHAFAYVASSILGMAGLRPSCFGRFPDRRSRAWYADRRLPRGTRRRTLSTCFRRGFGKSTQSGRWRSGMHRRLFDRNAPQHAEDLRRRNAQLRSARRCDIVPVRTRSALLETMILAAAARIATAMKAPLKRAAMPKGNTAAAARLEHLAHSRGNDIRIRKNRSMWQWFRYTEPSCPLYGYIYELLEETVRSISP